MLVLRRVVLSLAALAVAAWFTGAPHAAPGRSIEVVVTLDAPALAEATQRSRVLTAHAKAARLDLRSPTSVAYRRALTVAQRALAARIIRTIPAARVTWRYQVVLNGLAVVLPAAQLSRLASLEGVAKVWPSISYRPLLDRSPELIGANLLWGTDFTTAGNGVKIGIVDDGVDQQHPFFNPAGYTMPAGFPKGDTAFTTAKIIVARAFSPPTNSWKYARTPFDPLESEHGTHVAGIAAGDFSRGAIPGRGPLSGVAPNAYLGNYKVLTVPTKNFGLNGNAPEIAAGIEAAVKDGMDVINLSLGEPEIEPSRDLVVAAINAAADAGVVPAVAAGNDFADFGNGSVSSPGSAAKAITVAAVSKQLVVASFSSGGPTPISLELKPDVSAPGFDITSSLPPRAGTWGSLSGTSMASPHVAGAAALLRQRHPDWTVAQIKSALVLTGKPVRVVGTAEAPTTREGGGLINVPAANDPTIFATPSDVSFGLLRAGASATQSIELTDAGGGAGSWTVAVAAQSGPTGATVTTPATVSIPGELTVQATAPTGSAEQDATGFVTLTNGVVVRRIPYWFRVSASRLAGERQTVLRSPGTYHGQTKGKPALVTTYRYPETAPGLPSAFTGPEQVFRVRLAKPVANFGVVVVGQDRGVRTSPRVVVAADENRLAGNAALPLVINPYLDSFGTARPIAGAIRPSAGTYAIVFETPPGGAPGAFTFRYWVNDTSPPTVRLLTPSARRGSKLRLAVTDAGAGVDPASIHVTLDGKRVVASYARGRLSIDLAAVGRGRHRLNVEVADYQELKNMENVTRILPNTRVFTASFRVG